MSLDTEAIKARAEFSSDPFYAEDVDDLLAEVERLNRLIDAVHDELLQGGQNHEYRWRQAVTLLEPRRLARQTGGVS
ncbi:MAG TPA: hypothetical protein VIP77_16005 [Jiangellaceae bacterium]